MPTLELLKQTNIIVRQIEMAYREDHHAWNYRLRQINPEEIRRLMFNKKIGQQCEKCLTEKGWLKNGRYCSKEHSTYYRRITDCMYGASQPFGTSPYDENQDVRCVNCNKKLYEVMKNFSEVSIDHILPISKGGLEFDRENLQWMCLPCNLKKHNKIEDKKQKKLECCQ